MCSAVHDRHWAGYQKSLKEEDSLRKQPNNPTILALETGIGGGSISLYRETSELAFIAGDKSVSRSEDIIFNIRSVLLQAELTLAEIDTLAISRGPGSFTGLRIGLATALGLMRSLEIPCVGVPLIDAIVAAHKSELPLTVVLPMGKYEVVWKTYLVAPSVNSSEQGSVCSIDDIWSAADFSMPIKFLVHESLCSRLPKPFPGAVHLESLGFNLSKFVASQSGIWSGSTDLSPIYLQNPAKRSNLF